MKTKIKSILILSIAAIILPSTGFAQTDTEVAMVSQSDIDVTYDRPESYVEYLNTRGLSKKDVYKDYYTDKFIFDLGKMKSGQVKTIDIPFKNTSDHYIKITAVNEICGCLKAEFPMGAAGNFKQEEIKTGKLTFDSTGLSGKIRRAVEVRTFTNREEINYLVWIQVEISK